MRFGVVCSHDVSTFESLREAVDGAIDGQDVVIVLDEVGDGYSGVVSVVDGEPQITVNGVKGGTITTKIEGKRVLILDPVYVNELDVVEVG